ncbi:hypothetical protein [Nocardia sp. NPDC005745]|uniref:hypothetical protein n=1 Tax=Nocardia sp. NPDC005745 TaxID=3157061 RepID=UPI0033E890D1
MFTESEKKALDILLGSNRISEEFFLYWNDAVNADGYSSKLLLMFAAIDALIKPPGGGARNTRLREPILGQNLSREICGPPPNGLRNRLVHGEYFSPIDVDDYVTRVHEKIVRYINDEILHDNLIEEGVTHPQRNFYDNVHTAGRWIQQIDDAWPLALKKRARKLRS